MYVAFVRLDSGIVEITILFKFFLNGQPYMRMPTTGTDELARYSKYGTHEQVARSDSTHIK